MLCPKMMKIAHLDCFAGAAGDMLLASCLDAGLDAAPIAAALEGLGLPGWRLVAEPVTRGGIGGTKVDFELEGDEKGHRHLPEIQRMIEGAGFGVPLRDRMLEVFDFLAEAEAKAHRIAKDKVHFHEVGARDAILDICGVILAFDHLGIQRLTCSDLVVGTGNVRCAHGTLPVPAPGTLYLLEGLPIRKTQIPGECLTPTGAALLRVLVDEFQPRELTIRPTAIGYGAGTRDGGDVPNLIRLTVGESLESLGAESVVELALQVDNTSGELIGHAIGRAMEAGALDAWVLPALTKKNRPAHVFHVLCDESRRVVLEDLLLSELPTLGLRRSRVERRRLERRVETRETVFGPMKFKVRVLPDGEELAAPEMDEVQRVVREQGIAAPQVLARLMGGA
jgi:pyridinium-3,5-bisthiocarboxylic acid mononucleotide nickel chelatase